MRMLLWISLTQFPGIVIAIYCKTPLSTILDMVVKTLLRTRISTPLVDGLHKHDICDRTPLALAGEHNNPSILRTLLTNPKLLRICSPEELREEALQGAILSGHLPTLEFLISPEFGPVNFFFSAYCIEEPLQEGIMSSPLKDFLSQLYTTIKSYETRSLLINIGEIPSFNDQLLEVCTVGIQRVDLARHLLDTGATVQEDRLCANNRTRDDEDRTPRMPWNPLRAAIISGHEQTVRELLARDMDPNLTDDDILWQATRRGRFDMCRMLVKKGAFVDRAPSPMCGRRTPRWESLVVVAAFMSENRDLWRYLLNEGARTESPELAKDDPRVWRERTGKSMLNWRANKISGRMIEKRQMMFYYCIIEFYDSFPPLGRLWA